MQANNNLNTLKFSKQQLNSNNKIILILIINNSINLNLLSRKMDRIIICDMHTELGVVLTRQIWTINSFMQILQYQTVKHPKKNMNPRKWVWTNFF